MIVRSIETTFYSKLYGRITFDCIHPATVLRMEVDLNLETNVIKYFLACHKRPSGKQAVFDVSPIDFQTPDRGGRGQSLGSEGHQQRVRA
ncbi:hypothetical protein EVAR_32201_1 [Eumeta japonica]|uniref:Uncharacterized protein n=1 Tax=Eumeta variegata TaxID=151549 RepID=A0A4C1W0P8_EUMVA|nr:hypothetical protein EVAR_32201_1 [Eumeta japonica]